jgi:hypothetical protein
MAYGAIFAVSVQIKHKWQNINGKWQIISPYQKGDGESLENLLPLIQSS